MCANLVRYRMAGPPPPAAELKAAHRVLKRVARVSASLQSTVPAAASSIVITRPGRRSLWHQDVLDRQAFWHSRATKMSCALTVFSSSNVATGRGAAAACAAAAQAPLHRRQRRNGLAAAAQVVAAGRRWAARVRGRRRRCSVRCRRRRRAARSSCCGRGGATRQRRRPRPAAAPHRGAPRHAGAGAAPHLSRTAEPAGPATPRHKVFGFSKQAVHSQSRRTCVSYAAHWERCAACLFVSRM